MEKFDEFCDSCSYNYTKNPSVDNCTILRKKAREIFGQICDISNVKRSESEILKKPSVVERYHSVYLKRYVKGATRRRRLKEIFSIPVFHVSRRPDNPFNVKNVVENLRRKQMTSTLNEASGNVQKSSEDKDLCCSNQVKKRRSAKTRNWESIRYRYQLDYKEKLKMERENVSKEYEEMMRMNQKQKRVKNIAPLYQTSEERIRKLPHIAVVSNEHLAKNSSQRNSHRDIGESPKMTIPSSETQTQVSTFSGRPNISYDPRNFYDHTEDGNHVSEAVDLTRNHSIPVPRNDVQQIRLARHEPVNNIDTEIGRNEIMNDADAAVAVNLDHQIPEKSQCEDFDFAIPFNESNILIKVMTSDGRTTNSSQQTNSLLRDTLQCDAEPKQKLNAPKRLSYDEGSNTNNVRPDPDAENQWLQYIKNNFNKISEPREEYLNKNLILNRLKTIANPEEQTQANVAIPKDYDNYRSIPIMATGQNPYLTPENPQTSNYLDLSLTGRIKHDRPAVSNPRIIRPKVMHPNPYFRSDLPRNNLQYNEQLEDPNAIPLPVRRHSRVPSLRRHSPLPLIPDQRNAITQHMEYIYGNHPNYHHDFMVRNRRQPLDVPHSNFIGSSVYSPYDTLYLQYRNEMERIPHQPYPDPFIHHHHNMHVAPVNRITGFQPPRPSVAGVYRYLNPQNIHQPVWIYPHMLER